MFSDFTHLLVAVQLFQDRLLNRLSLPYCIFLPPLSKINCRCMSLFLGSLFCFIDPFVCFCANTNADLVIVAL